MTPRIPFSREEYDRLCALLVQHGSKAAGARAAELAESTFKTRLLRGKQLYGEAKQEERVVDLPTFPSDDIEAPEILAHMSRRFEQRVKREDALHWFRVGLPTDEVIGLTVVGDPHLGSNGCNTPLLEEDVRIMAETPGVHAINIGDSVDNWAGNLVRLYAENDVSKQTERTLARWFLQDSGVPWCLFLLGNHDVMDAGFAAYLETLNASTIPLVDWRAKFRLVFPGGREVRVIASHDFKGSSIYNPLHGQKRASLWGEDADLWVSGHRHNWAIQQDEMEDGRVVTFARARGYKWIDDFALRRGFSQQQHGASIMFVIDPLAKTPTGLVHPFADIREGAEYLKYKRRQT
jgi:hypothetical protein